MHRRFAMPKAAAVATFVGLFAVAGAAPAGTEGQAAPESAPAQVPTFGAAVDVILVDAVVTDGQGQTVTGLAAEDFVVREDGEPQALTSFEAVDLPAAPPAPPAGPGPGPAASPRASANDEEPAESSRRVFLVVMDDASLGLESAAAARNGATRFLSRATRPGDLVSIVVPGAGLTWSARLPEGQARLVSIIDSVKGARALSLERASDGEALRVAGALDPLAQERVRERLDAAGSLPRATRMPGESDEEYTQRNRALQEPFVQMDAQRQLDLSRERRRQLFEAVTAALDAVASVKGRKSVLLFSEGFVQEANDQRFRGLLAAARRNNASIYHMDVQRLGSGTAAENRGVVDISAPTRLANPEESAGAEVVAKETGGFALHNPNDLEAGLTRIARESSSYYLLGYSPTNLKRDGKYRRLQVEVRRAGLEVRARRGYYAPAPETSRGRSAAKPDADPELERALASAVPEREIAVRLAAFTLQPVDKGRVRVQLVAELGLKPALFAKEPDGSLAATLDVALALNHVKGAGRQRTPWNERKIKVSAQAEGLDIQVPIEGAFDLPGGACQAKLVVRERASRALGSVVHDFEVPDPGSWRVSTPILSDMPGEGLSSAPRMLVRRSFVAGSPLYCYLEVYATPTKAAAAPRVSLAYTLVDAQGKTRKTQAASPLTPGSTGIPTRLETIPLSGLSPGRYELRLSVRDEASGRTQELREPFVLRRPKHPDLAIYLELLRAFHAGEVARASSGVMEWRPQDLEGLAASLPREDTALRRAALLLHTALAIRLWSNARSAEADAQVGIGRAVLGKDSPPELHRDWLLSLGYHHLTAATPAKALPFFEECARLFPAAADAWLGAGMCHELIAFPDGFAPAERPPQDEARKAERCYREAARTDPRLAEARLRLGRVLGKTGTLDEAEKELAAAVEASAEGPLTAFAQVFWGGVRDSRGDLTGALSHYEAALAADHASETAAFALSEALFRSGRHRRAAEILASALSAPRSTPISSWHGYHLAFSRRDALFAPPQETAAIAVGQKP